MFYFQYKYAKLKYWIQNERIINYKLKYFLCVPFQDVDMPSTSKTEAVSEKVSQVKTKEKASPGKKRKSEDNIGADDGEPTEVKKKKKKKITTEEEASSVTKVITFKEERYFFPNFLRDSFC